jgi:8-oxo-dGTP pyrophosphatase MutT (NUDIX family)
VKRYFRFLLAFLYPVAKLYWFIFRPVRTGAKVILINEGDILLVRHSYGDYYWTFPGGGIKKGEEPMQTGLREVWEEVGLRLEKVVFLGKIKNHYEYKDDTIWAYYGSTKDRNIKIDNFEIVEAKWFNLNSLPKDLGANAEKIIELYKKI